MNMIKIKIKTKDSYKEFSEEKNTTAEAVLKKCQSDFEHQILAVKIGNKIYDLNKPLTHDVSMEFLDLRHPAGSRIYQRSLTFLYIKAIYDIFGHIEVVVQNPLNKGIYTEIKLGKVVSESDIKKIDKRMQELIEKDVPFIRQKYSREDALKILDEQNMPAKRRLLVESKETLEVPLYTCGDFKDYFYGHMVPSAGYIHCFELRKYEDGILLRHPFSDNPESLPAYRDDRKLFAMFEEAASWGKMMSIKFASDLNDSISSGRINDVIKISEALHEKKVAEIADMIKRSGRRIILICGPSSSGKTTFANRLMIQLRVNGQHPSYIGTDDYFVERTLTPIDEFGKPNFEDIEAIDVELFNKNMNDLLSGKEVDLPKFNFIDGTKEYGKRYTKLKPGEPIVIEGIHGLNDKLTAQIYSKEKFKIYISPLTQLSIDDHNRISTTDGRLIRRMVRDNQFRNYNAKKTISAWPDVRKGEEKNIFPYNGDADVMFNSALIYEMAILRKYAEPLLKEISIDDPEYSEASRLLRLLKHFKPIEDEYCISNNSIMKEFIGGSIFFRE